MTPSYSPLLVLCSASLALLLISSTTTQLTSAALLPEMPESRNSDPLGLVRRYRRDTSEEEETEAPEQQCEIEIQEVRKVKGKCIKLLGGMPACQSEQWLDPASSVCQ